MGHANHRPACVTAPVYSRCVHLMLCTGLPREARRFLSRSGFDQAERSQEASTYEGADLLMVDHEVLRPGVDVV